MKPGKKVIIHSLVFSFILFANLEIRATTVRTPGEEANYLEYSQHEEIARFLSIVDHLSPEMRVEILGWTEEKRNYSPQELLLCIINEEGVVSSSLLNRNKPTVMVIASQHGNEQSAKEAALALIRDLALGEAKHILKKLNFLIIPQANPYGNFFDQRRNEQDLDLNRDHVKLESPEVTALHQVFRAWMPEVTIDVHEKGDDFYRVSIGCVSNANINSEIQRFSREEILREVEKKLRKKKIPFHEYLVTQPMGIDSSAGVRYRREEVESREMMKRYSTTDLNDGRNSFGIYETFSFIQECASRHDLKTLRERTGWQYLGLRYFIETVASRASEILSLTRKCRNILLKKAMTYSDQDLVHLRMRYMRDEREPQLVIKKFERLTAPARGILKVEKKAGEIITSEDIEPYPSEYRVTTEVVKNWFPGVEPLVSVPCPLGYIIPGQHEDIVETMLAHGIAVSMFTKSIPLEVEAYRVLEVIPSEYDYLPPKKIEVEKKTHQTVVRKGDYYVSCAQPAANLIPCLLEPQSQYGFIRYWKYRIVPENGELFSILRMVKKIDLPLAPYKNWKR